MWLYSFCDLEKSRSSAIAKKFSIRPRPPTNKYTCEVSSKSYCQFVRYSVPIIDLKVARRKKEYGRNTLTQVDTL